MKRASWSQEESDLLEKVYKFKTSKELQEIFPQYTNTQILRRAKKLGLKKDPLVAKQSRVENSIIQRQDLWTDEEKQIVIEYYPTEGALGVQERLPKERTIPQIKHMAYRLEVNREQKDLIWKMVDCEVETEENFVVTIKYKGY